MADKPTAGNARLIRDYFGQDRKVTMQELKDLTAEERGELADMIRAINYVPSVL